ncbi:hypothetical protein EZ313_21095 [Ramlibacter henchirensis]|uniref:Uncharacterized protein n=1 Tax=Ramlibacter henchirensis TaxID=204072 RepID=A0A4Z0BR95_9BURK|nr:hypothetical protein [Ramlibacter henchirensis]TFZ00930.1 hypothetical protein EZ313_21095 [Ramlibacter henchirensis]
MFNTSVVSVPMPHAGLQAFPFPADEPEAAGSRDIAVEDLTIRCLRKATDIRDLAQLRGQIDLKAAASADPQFATREKKETSWVASSLSSSITA